MKANKKLDLCLGWHYDHPFQKESIENISKVIGVDSADIAIINEKLIELKYLSYNTEKTIYNQNLIYPYINFHGKIFYESAFPFNKEPFRSKQLKDKIKITIQWLKAIMLFANGVIALIIAYWAVTVSNRTNELEKDKIEAQKQLITEMDNVKSLQDSLTEMRQELFDFENKINTPEK